MKRNSTIEYCATQYAFNLLMPEDRVREFVKAEKHIDKIANHFNVTFAAAKERLLQLGYKLKK